MTDVAGTTDIEKVSDKIRKLLSLAGSPNEFEATAALEKAHELLEKYNLDIMDVETKDDNLPDLIQGETPYSGYWERVIYRGVALSNYCKTIGTGNGKLTILGRLPNVMTTVELSRWIIQQVERISLEEATNYRPMAIINGRMMKTGISKTKWRNDFLDGVSARIYSRLQEFSLERQDQNMNVSALTIRLDQEASDFLYEKYPNRTDCNYTARGSSGYYAGVKAGDGVGLVAPSRHVGSGALRLNGGS